MKNKVSNLIARCSIQFKLTITLTGIIILIIFSLWFINRTFLADYYLQSKIDSLGKTYEEINNTFLESKDQSADSSQITLKLERLVENRNVSVYIITASDRWFNVFEWAPTKDDNGNYNERYEQIWRMAKDYLLESNPGGRTKDQLKHTDSYDIYSNFDSRIESRYVDLIGNLIDGDIILIRTNLESMKESVETACLCRFYIGSYSSSNYVLCQPQIYKTHTEAG